MSLKDVVFILQLSSTNLFQVQQGSSSAAVSVFPILFLMGFQFVQIGPN